MTLEPNEKIECWRVVVETSKGRQIQAALLGVEIPEDAARMIDESIEDKFPVTWPS